MADVVAKVRARRGWGSCIQMLPDRAAGHAELADKQEPRYPGRAVRAGRSGLQGGNGGRAAVGQEVAAPGRLVVLADGGRGCPEHVQGAQEALVRLVLPGDRAVTVPSGPAGLV